MHKNICRMSGLTIPETTQIRNFLHTAPSHSFVPVDVAPVELPILPFVLELKLSLNLATVLVPTKQMQISQASQTPGVHCSTSITKRQNDSKEAVGDVRKSYSTINKERKHELFPRRSSRTFIHNVDQQGYTLKAKSQQFVFCLLLEDSHSSIGTLKLQIAIICIFRFSSNQIE